MKRMLSIMAASALSVGVAVAADVQVTANITADTIWTNDNEYILNGFIFVTGGASLTIEPGTVVRANPGTGALASALIIARDSKIYALGTPSDPIIFTALADPMDGSWTPELGGAWGGVVILGNAPLNSNKSGTPTGDIIEEAIEGIPTAFGDLVIFGGDDPDDNSGIFRYVSIRFGGSQLLLDSELNGLTMGGVGRGTLVEFVEVFANADDGIEWFGGTVDARFLAVAFQGDDGFDYDEGWVGKGQFWFSITNGALEDANDSFTPDNGFELDGEENSLSDLIGGGLIYNATSIGPGVAGGQALRIRDNGFVKIHNSIFTGYTGAAVRIEEDSADRIDPTDEATAIEISYNIWGSFAGTTPAALAHGDEAAGANDDEAYIWSTAALENIVQDPLLRAISRGTVDFEGDGGLDPRPQASSPALVSANLKALPANDDFFIGTQYLGAFASGSNWLNGWTYLSQAGYLPPSLETVEGSVANTSVRTSLDIAEGETVAVGLVISGNAPRMVLIRAEGEGLANDNVANPASATQIKIYDQNAGAYIQNDRAWTNWSETAESSAIATLTEYVGLSDLDNDDTSAVALVSLRPGSYAIAITNPDGTGGEAVISTTLIDL